MIALKIACLVAVAAFLGSAAADEAKSSKVEFEIFTRPYFEKNTSGLEGEVSHLVFTDEKAFEKVFGFGFVMKDKAKLLPKDAFDKHLAIAVITRGMSLVEYKILSATLANGTLTLKYKSEAKAQGGGFAKYATPVIVLVPREGIKKVEFIENDKKAATAEVGK